ncbi:MAG: acetate--CoA ligase family protein [Dehalococcoidia bacterium]
MKTTDQMRLFLEPGSVALIGIPRRTGRASYNILENLLDMSFPGRLYPVNPHSEDILGIKTYPTVEELPPGIDLAVIMISRGSVPEAVEGCAQRGIGAIIVVSDGFAEADGEGKDLQTRIVNIAKAAGIRILGPNSLGVVNNFYKFSSTFLPVSSEKSPVALVSQSGGFFEGFSEFAAGKAIDLGNTCDVNHADALDYLEDDPETRVIALHIEGIEDGARFLKAARRVSRKKPILVLKTGRSQPGTRAISSHTGSLTGRDEVYGAAFRQAGLIRVNDVDELGDVVKALLHLPPPRGNRVAMITATGGVAIMVLDALEPNGFEAARLSPETVDKLRDLFPPWSPPSNPVDIMTPAILHGYKKVYQAALQALLEDGKVDAILCIAGAPTLKTIGDMAGGKPKPVLTWVVGRWGDKVTSRAEEVGYRAIFPTPERALRALAALRRRWLFEQAERGK